MIGDNVEAFNPRNGSVGLNASTETGGPTLKARWVQNAYNLRDAFDASLQNLFQIYFKLFNQPV